MDESNENDSSVNIYPERQRKKAQSPSETSQYFERSTTSERSEDEPKSKPSRERQARLSFVSGQLTTQAPLTNPDKNNARRQKLSDVAAETTKLLPGLLKTRLDAPPNGFLCEGKLIEKIDAGRCPRLPPTKILVINSDSIDAALSLRLSSKPACVLNMANAYYAGGGWKHGSLAQEECLCYRTSLSFTLKHSYYPLPNRSSIYSPTVLVIRSSMKDHNQLLDFRDPGKLKVISVVSVAAVCRPAVMCGQNNATVYANFLDQRLMEDKIRIVLRTAIRNKHRQIVLGALGCGAFGNPKDEVASMFASILTEPEFQGGWWEDVVFAVLDDGRGNFQTFHQALDGLSV